MYASELRTASAAVLFLVAGAAAEPDASAAFSRSGVTSGPHRASLRFSASCTLLLGAAFNYGVSLQHNMEVKYRQYKPSVNGGDRGPATLKVERI